MNLNNIDVVLFDLDGTVYYGSKIIPGANETISFFRNEGKKVYFTTNNSTKSRQQIFDRLRNLGVDCKLEEVLTSGYVAALTAKKHELDDIYIFGSDNLKEEFRNLGLTVNEEETARNLLIGYDPSMTYEGLTKALQVALHAKCIIACNRERVYPGENARLMPGCGAMTAPIEWCANRECDYIVGKPNTLMIDILSEIEGTSPKKLLVIGDTYESDIVMANCAGSQSILLTKTAKEDTVCADSIKDVPKFFE